MKRYIPVVLALAAASLGATAKDITPQQAQEIAARYVSLSNRNNAPMRSFSVSTTATEPTTVPYYAFNDAQGNGFVLVSGDDCVPPVLAYSSTGAFDEAEMPLQMSEWLQSVTAQIASLRAEGNGTARPLASLDENPTVVVPALLSSTWNQTYPYNRQTPTINDQNAYTGCVATATAQVMRYYQWPAKGFGSVSYDTPNYDQKSISIDFTQSAYDWDNMRDNYNIYSFNWTTAQANAVSLLMRDIGAACHLQYSTSATAGFSADAAMALMRNFGYKAEYYYKSDYSTAKWMEMIKAQLDAGHPVIYSGVGLESGGHEFVVDGYDSNGYLHVNWGWGGQGDGFFALANFGSHNYCLYTDAVFAEPDRFATAGSDFQTPLWAAVNFGQGQSALSSYTTTVSDVGYLDLYISMECGSYITDFDGTLRVTLKDSGDHIVATIDEDNYQITTETENLVYRMDPDLFAALADGTYEVVVESTYNRADSTPFGTWKRPIVDANRIFVTKSGDQLTFDSRDKHNAPLTTTSLEISSDESGKLLTSSVLDVTFQLEAIGDDCLGKVIVLTLTSTDDTTADPINITICKVAVFETLPYLYAYTFNGVAASGVKPGHYTASLSSWSESEGYTDITPESLRIPLTFVSADGEDAIEQLHSAATIVSRYDLQGRRIGTAPKGTISIVKLSDGRVVKGEF
jgi:hypothetical protein